MRRATTKLSFFARPLISARRSPVMGAGIASPCYIDDRENDVLISGGENIYPAELENILSECPQIAEPSSSAAPTATGVKYR